MSISLIKACMEKMHYRYEIIWLNVNKRGFSYNTNKYTLISYTDNYIKSNQNLYDII